MGGSAKRRETRQISSFISLYILTLTWSPTALTGQLNPVCGVGETWIARTPNSPGLRPEVLLSPFLCD